MMSLPKTFRQLEYLEFTNAQSLMIPKPRGYITGFGMEIKYNHLGAVTYDRTLYQYFSSGTSLGVGFYTYKSSTGITVFSYPSYSNSTSDVSLGAITDNNDHIISFRLLTSGKTNKAYFDGTEIVSKIYGDNNLNNGDSDVEMYKNIFIGSNFYKTPQYSGRIYYVKFFIGEDEIRNLVPVQRKSDNELGYYDLDSNEFFTNTLTTPWVAGPVVDENSINKVVYGNETLIDLTGDTVTAADVAQGKTFHLADGSQAIGTSEGGSLEIVNYTLKASYARYNGINYSYFIGFMITNPDGSIKYIPNIAPQIGTHLVANDIGSSWQKNTSTYNTQWGHEFGSGGTPTSGSPKYWTITGTCFKGATIRPYIVGYGYTSSGYKAQVKYNIFGNTGSKLFDAYTAAQNTTRVGGFWVCNPIIINSSFTCTNTISNSGSNISICTLNLTEI